MNLCLRVSQSPPPPDSLHVSADFSFLVEQTVKVSSYLSGSSCLSGRLSVSRSRSRCRSAAQLTKLSFSFHLQQFYVRSVRRGFSADGLRHSARSHTDKSRSYEARETCCVTTNRESARRVSPAVGKTRDCLFQHLIQIGP